MEDLVDGIVRFLGLPKGMTHEMGECALQYAGKNFDKGRLMDEMDGFVRE